MISAVAKYYKGYNGHLTVMIPENNNIESYEEKIKVRWGPLRESDIIDERVYTFDETEYGVYLTVRRYYSAKNRRYLLVNIGLNKASFDDLIERLQSQFGKLTPDEIVEERKDDVVNEILDKGFYAVPPNRLVMKEIK